MKIEDIRNGIAENPELKTALLTELDADINPYLTGKGFVVRTADEQTAWEKQFEDEKVKPISKRLYDGIEADTLASFEFLGVKKESNTERAFDLVKKAGTMSKAKIDELQQQLTAALDGKGDEVSQKQIEALTAQLAAANLEKDNLATGFTQKELAWKAGNDQEKAFAELHIAVPAHISEKDKGDFIASKRQQLLITLNSQYKVEERDGKLVYVDGDGEIQMNGANVATATDLLKKVGKYDFEAPRKAGSGGDGGNGGNGDSTEYAGVTDKASLYAAAAKKGLVSGSADWMAFVKAGATAKSIKIDGLEEKKA